MSEEKKKLSKKSIILISVLSVLALVIGGAIWFVSDLIGQYITDGDDPIFKPTGTVDPSSHSTLKPRKDPQVQFFDGTLFDGFVAQWEEFSTEDDENFSDIYNLVKDKTDSDFVVIHIGVIGEDDIHEDYSFDSNVFLYIAVPMGTDTDMTLYVVRDGKICDASYNVIDDYYVLETDVLETYVLSEDKDLAEDAPVVTPTPTPEATPTPTPVVTPTPEATPTPTPEATPTPTPEVTPTPTPVVTPTPTPVVTPKPTPVVTPKPTVVPTAPPVQTLPPNSKDVINIALFGLDTRKNNFTGRSDTMMILSINTKTNKMTLTSIMRDLYVPYVNDKGVVTGKYGKINAAFANWGVQGAVNTIENYFGIEIQNFAVVNFVGIKDIIEILGGVTMKLSKKEHGVVFYDKSTHEKATAGTYHLTPAQTLKYMSIRKIDNDRYRTLRQGKVLQALMDKFSSASWDELYQLLVKCSAYVKTDMNLSRMATVALKMFEIKDGGLNHSSYPYDNGTSGWWASKSVKGQGSVVYEVNYEWQMNWFKKRVYAVQ